MLNFLYTVIIYPLIQIIEFSFVLFDSVFKNQGIAVIGVSLAVSILCLPLYIVAEHWQQIQRDTEKKLEPGIQRIKSVFKGDEQYMILTTFYKENHYHPLMALRSSFGLLIQIPFFMAAYSFLSNLESLRGYSFLFIRDMGAQDALFSIGGFPVNVLPIAMTLINIIAGAIYTKGFKFKDKITIYGMALIFLVILYSSPAGLVLYWTMNNVFSLVKNIFYKIKNPAKVLYIIFAAAIFGLDFYVLFVHNGFLHKRILLAAIATALLGVPFLAKYVSRLLDTTLKSLAENKKSRFGIFFVSSVALCLFAGSVIPSFIIGSSPVEFSNIDGYGSPLYFIYNSTIQTFGLFVFWMSCVYFLFNARIQAGFTVIMPVLLFVALIDAFVFSGDYGTLSRLITFAENIDSAPAWQSVLNSICIIIAVCVPVILLKFKKEKILNGILAVILIAEAGISVVHIAQIQKGYSEYKKTVADKIQEVDSISPLYHVSKAGKNVFVIMLDRAENSYVVPIFEAFPELYDIYDGFTLYHNTASWNQGTLLASPPLFGGYEYIPSEINKRKTEKLVDKQNEALLTLPRIFTEQADFTAQVSDLSWANYSWIPDMSICAPYEKIEGFNVERKYTDLWVKQNPDKVRANITSTCLKRNLVWFSLFKAVPLFARDSVYDDGSWWSSDEQTSDIMEFIDYYSALDYMPELTDFSAEGNKFFAIVNDTTHSGQVLQAPDYVPSIDVEDRTHSKVEKYRSVSGNIAAFKRFGEWLQYLKENGCYDNSRIIFVADHGIGTTEGFKLDFEQTEFPQGYNPDHNHPLLLVKDFNAKGKLSVNEDFMTNADVPAIATKGIIENPKNPATGKEIKEIPPEQKKASGVVLTHNWRPGGNGLNTFTVPEDDWYTISENIFEAKNWQKGIK